jgi:hypothetical protein
MLLNVSMLTVVLKKMIEERKKKRDSKSCSINIFVKVKKKKKKKKNAVVLGLRSSPNERGGNRGKIKVHN